MNIELKGVTWVLEQKAPEDQLDSIPAALAQLLSALNGFILWNGALHVRGLCEDPIWHSLQVANDGNRGFQGNYQALELDDCVFAEDCLGDQYFLRDGDVYQLFAETGEFDFIADGLGSFLSEAMQDPMEILGMQPLLQLQSEGSELQPGQLIHAYPPFCTKEAADGVSLKAVLAMELYAFHAELSRKLGPDGSEISVEITR